MTECGVTELDFFLAEHGGTLLIVGLLIFFLVWWYFAGTRLPPHPIKKEAKWLGDEYDDYDAIKHQGD
jgi:hypothetical protein